MPPKKENKFTDAIPATDYHLKKLKKKTGKDAHEFKADVLQTHKNNSKYDIFYDKKTKIIILRKKDGKGNDIETNIIL